MARTILNWLAILAVLLSAGAADAQIRARSAQDRNQVATLVYSSSEAAASFGRQASAELFRLRGVIDERDRKIIELNARLSSKTASAASQKATIAELERLLDEAAREKDEFVALLAKQDQDFERERQVLLEVGNSMLETPDGAEALRLFNLGGKENWAATKAILARKTAIARRNEAVMYSQAAERGLETTASAISKWEQVVLQTPTMADLMQLAGLYQDAGQSNKISALVTRMEQIAANDFERIEVMQTKARFAKLRGDLQDSFAANKEVVRLAELFRNANPVPAAGNLLAVTRYELAIAAIQVQDAKTAKAQIDLGLAAIRAGLGQDPANVMLQQEAIRGEVLSAAAQLFLDIQTIEGARKLSGRTGQANSFVEPIGRARAMALANSENPYLLGFLEGLICGTSGFLLDLAPDAAGPMVDECVANNRTRVEKDPTSLERLQNYVDALDKSVQLSAKRGLWLDADRTVTTAVRTARDALALNPALPGPRMILAKMLHYQAQVDAHLLRRDRVMPALDEAIAMLDDLVRADPGDIQLSRTLSDALWTAADFNQLVGGVPASTPYLQRGLALSRKRAALPGAIWTDQLVLINHVTAMATMGIAGTSPAEALAELDRMERSGLVAPEGQAQFAQIRASMIALRDARAAGGRP